MRKREGETMPFLTIYLREGCDDASIETCMREITAAGADTLENTLTRMIRITVKEAKANRVYENGICRDAITPTVVFNIGPGRSDEAKNSFMNQIADILHKNLGCPKESVRGYIMEAGNPNNFCIGGKLKDFSKKVK